MDWLYLAVAIACEVVATSALKATDGFTRWQPSALVVVGYVLAFFFLSLTVRSVPIGVAYAIWSGVGVVLVSISGWLLYAQRLDFGALLGTSLIVIGVLVIKLFSNVQVH